MPPLASNIGSPEAADCAAVMPKYGLIAGAVTSVTRGPPESVHRAPTGTTASHGSSKALLTGWTPSGGESGG